MKQLFCLLLATTLAATEPTNWADLTTFGKCECPGQITVSNDCSSAFYCSDPEAENAQNGAAISCGKDAIANLDTASNQLTCLPRPDSYICFGQLITDCPAQVEEEEDVGWNIDCACENQIWVSPDCKNTFRCNAPGSDLAGVYAKCPTGSIFLSNMLGYKLECSSPDSEEVCNGGFHYGCQGVETPIIPDDNVPTTPDEPDVCECSGQVSIKNDCTEAFVCTDPEAGEDSGFSFKCDADNEIVLVDFKTMDFSCEPRPENYVCPGSFVTDCPNENGSFEVTCNRKNEIWISPDCRTAFR